MSSLLDGWKPLVATCMLGAVVHEKSMAMNFPDKYHLVPREERDALFAQALHETAMDFAAETGEPSALFLWIKHRLEAGRRMEGMHCMVREASEFVGIPLAEPFLLPETDQAKDLFIIFDAHRKQHPEWREGAMAVVYRFVCLLEEHQMVS